MYQGLYYNHFRYMSLDLSHCATSLLTSAAGRLAPREPALISHRWQERTYLARVLLRLLPSPGIAQCRLVSTDKVALAIHVQNR